MSSKQESSVMQEESDLASDQYVIQKIVDKKTVKGKVFYLCKWKNWDEKDNTWEPADNLSKCPQLIDEYLKRIKGPTLKKIDEPIQKLEPKKKSSSKALSNEEKQQDSKKISKIKRRNETTKQIKPQNQTKTNQAREKTIPKNRAQTTVKFQTSSKNISSNTENVNSYYNKEDEDIIDRINYHQYVGDRLYYVVDSHTKQGKILPCYLKSSEQLKKSNPLLLIKYIQDFIMEVQQYNNERRMAQKNAESSTD